MATIALSHLRMKAAMTKRPTSESGKASQPKTSLYNLVGGEQGIMKLVEMFYDLVETYPECHQLHLLHLRGNGVAHSRVEQFHFLSGFLGGPRLYQEKHGHANVRTMHEHVEINSATKDAWLKCMALAMDAVDIESSTKQQLMDTFTVIAERLVNQAD